jgi:hypothetical protein
MKPQRRLRSAHRAGAVFERLWEESGCWAAITELAGKRKHGFGLERAVFLAALHRLFLKMDLSFFVIRINRRIRLQRSVSAPHLCGQTIPQTTQTGD